MMDFFTALTDFFEAKTFPRDLGAVLARRKPLTPAHQRRENLAKPLRTRMTSPKGRPTKRSNRQRKHPTKRRAQQTGSNPPTLLKKLERKGRKTLHQRGSALVPAPILVMEKEHPATTAL